LQRKQRDSGEGTIDEMIEYASVGAAEGALGRNLTTWELKWFEYTANVSDYKLYCLNIVFLFLIFNFAPLPSVLLDFMKVKAFEKYRLQPGVHNSRESIWQCYKRVTVLFFTVVGPLQLSSYPAVKMVGVHCGLPLPSFKEILLQLTIYFIVEDYSNYWIHRWLHSEWAYNNIHYIHHEFTAPMSFSAPYVHVAEMVVLGIPTFLGPALVPGHMITLWLWIALRQLEAIETHSGYDFPWSPTKLIPFYGGPEHHDYHHLIGGKSQSNFASIFTYCDWIYGTDKGFRYQRSFLHKARKARLGKEVDDWTILNLPTEKQLRAKAKTT
jgi:4,4-dimethyl-9beta,19-cyclopropylsterol-4alpha-methyl oxidase